MSAVAACASAAAAAGYALIVTIEDQTVTNAFSVSAASAGIRLTREGQFQTGFDDLSLNPVYDDVGGNQWADRESAQAGDAFEAMLETTTGTLSNGTADSWLALSTTRSWDVGQNGSGSKTFTGTLKIRRGGVIKDTAAISMTATVTPV